MGEPEIERLLEHAGFVRAVARGVLGDTHRAEDVTQETWLQALRRPPRPGRVRAWLAAVAGNAARMRRRADGRRVAREQAAARPDGTRSTVDLVADLELRQRVVREVLRLEDPLRSVLLLRYFEGLAFREIAQRQGVSREAARKRHARALALLRRRFRGSLPALSLLALPRPAAAGGLVVGKKITLAFAALVLLLAGFGVFHVARRADPRAEWTARSERAATAPADSGTAQRSERAKGTEPKGEAYISGTVRQAVGLGPLEGATVRCVPLEVDAPARDVLAWREGWEWRWRFRSVADVPAVHTTRTGADGAFSFAASPDRAWIVVADAPGFVRAQSRVVRSGPRRISLTLQRGATRRFRVVDPEGQPVAGARILVFPGSSRVRLPRAAATSDSSGAFSLPLAARESLLVRADGFRWIFVTDAHEVDETLRLEPEFRLGGVVTRPDGQPVAGAVLGLEHLERLVVQRTADDGRFLFTGLPPTERKLVVAAEGAGARKFELMPGDERLRIVLADHDVRGTVLLPDGAPAEGATVEGGHHAWAGDPEPLTLDLVTSITDEDGTFVLRDLTPGAWLFTTQANGLTGRAEIRIETDGPPRDVTIRLRAERPRSYARIRVVDQDGASPSGKVRFPRQLVGPADDGAFLLQSREPAGRRVFAVAFVRGTALRGGTWCRLYETKDGRDPVELVLRPPAPVTFVVRGPNGTPLPPDVVPRVTLRQPQPLWRARTRAEARPTFRVFPALEGAPDSAYRDYALTVHAGDAGILVADPWTPPATGGVVELRLRRGVRLSGRVPGATRVVVEERRFRAPGIEPRVDEDGRFAARVPAGGPVRLVAMRDGQRLLKREIDVPANVPELDLGTLAPPPVRTVEGRVVDPSGRGVGGAVIRVARPGRDGPRAVTRADGRFAVTGRIAGRARLHVRKQGWAAAPVRPGDAPLVVRMHPQARVDLRIEGWETGGAVQDIRVRHRGETWRPSWGGSSWRCRVEALPPGRSTLVVRGKTWTRKRELRLVAGETVLVTVHADR